MHVSAFDRIFLRQGLPLTDFAFDRWPRRRPGSRRRPAASRAGICPSTCASCSWPSARTAPGSASLYFLVFSRMYILVFYVYLLWYMHSPRTSHVLHPLGRPGRRFACGTKDPRHCSAHAAGRLFSSICTIEARDELYSSSRYAAAAELWLRPPVCCRFGWHDSYTYSKALAELAAVRAARDHGIPMAVLRPTIVESAMREPAP